MTRKLNKEQYSRSYEKKRLAGFWKLKWIPGRTVETWMWHIKNNRRNKEVMRNAFKKLALENLILPGHAEELIKMLMSEDEENQYLAVSIVHGLKPRMFEKRKKNTNT